MTHEYPPPYSNEPPITDEELKKEAELAKWAKELEWESELDTDTPPSKPTILKTFTTNLGISLSNLLFEYRHRVGRFNNKKSP